MDKFEEINELIKDMGLEFIGFVRIPSETEPSDLDIDKIYSENEIFSYNRIKSIAEADVNKVKWNVAVKHLMTDMSYIFQLITLNKVQHSERLKEFKENCKFIINYINDLYDKNINTINSYTVPKSIDEMNEDELREYIRTHNIK